MSRHSTARIICRFAATGAASLDAYALAIRPWHLRWGATDEEIARPTQMSSASRSTGREIEA